VTPAPLRLAYVSNARIPGDRAHAYQSVLVCEALRQAGADLELIHPRRRGITGPARHDELARLYGIRERFQVTQLYSLDLIDLFPRSLQRPWFLLQALTYAVSLRRYLADKPDVLVYVRDPHTLHFLRVLRAPFGGRIVFEAHRVPRGARARRLMSRALADTACIVVLNQHLAGRYRELGVPEAKVAVVPSGVDRRKFERRPAPAAHRQALGIPGGVPVVCYAGSLETEKGIYTLLECAGRLSDATVVVVGGWPPVGPALRDFCRRHRITNVRLTGQVTPLEVTDYLLLADVLVAPNSAGSPASAEDTSPLKFFEYVAAGKPIVASDVPALRAAAAECAGCAVVWVRPDDPESLAAGIRMALRQPPPPCSAAPPDWLSRARDILRHIASHRPERPGS